MDDYLILRKMVLLMEIEIEKERADRHTHYLCVYLCTYMCVSLRLSVPRKVSLYLSNFPLFYKSLSLSLH